MEKNNFLSSGKLYFRVFAISARYALFLVFFLLFFSQDLFAIKLEEAQRAFSERYYIALGEYTGFQPRFSDLTSPGPFPEDGFYAEDLADPNKAAFHVSKLAEQLRSFARHGFWGHYFYFYDTPDLSATQSFNPAIGRFTLFPLITSENYIEAFKAIQKFICKLKYPYRIGITRSDWGSLQVIHRGRADWTCMEKECLSMEFTPGSSVVHYMDDPCKVNDELTKPSGSVDIGVSSSRGVGGLGFSVFRAKTFNAGFVVDLSRMPLGPATAYGKYLLLSDENPFPPPFQAAPGSWARIGAIAGMGSPSVRGDIQNADFEPEIFPDTYNLFNKYGWYMIDTLGHFTGTAVVICEPNFQHNIRNCGGDGEDCSTCPSGDCSAGGSQVSSFNNEKSQSGFGSFQIGLGTGSEDQYPIFLRANFGEPDEANYSPRLLSVKGSAEAIEIKDASGYLRQAKAPQSTADIITLSESQYEIRFYTVAQTSDDVNGSGLYTFTGSPGRVWTIENPNPGIHNNSLKITETVDGSATIHQYDWTTDLTDTTLARSVTLTTGNGLRKEIHDTFIDYASGDRTETITIKNQDETTVSKEVTIFHVFPWGEGQVQRIVDPDGAALTTTWSYDETTDNPEHLQQVIHPSGYWERYEYDDYGRVVKLIAQYLDAPPGSAENDSRVTTTTYGETADPAVTVVETLLDQEIGRRYTVYAPGETREIEAHAAGAAWDDPLNLVTITKTLLGTEFQGEIESVKRPDGILALYQYSKNGSQKTTIMETGQPDAGDTEIIDGTRTVTLTDLADNILSETVYDIASGLQLSSAITTEMDEFNRPIRVDYDDGTHTITNYGCCGIDSFTDRQGITTFYMHDELKRPSTVTRAGISTVTTYDAVGNILKTVERGTDNSPITLNTSTFDLAGRQTSSMNALNRITTFAETIDSNGHTVRTTTLPNDLTQIRTYAQDGSLLSISGTGAHPVNYEYGVEADGFFTKEIKVGPQGAATEWTKTYEDILGRPYKTLFPDGSFQISSYNSLGQLVKETDPDGVIRLYQYNGRGEQEYEAIDMNRNGVIDFAGTDRIRRIQDDATIAHGTIVRRSTITQWDKDNNANPVTVSVNETSADGLQQWITTDGLTTHIQTAYNGTGGRTVVTTSPDGTNTTEIFQDDVLTSSITQRNGVGTLSSLSYAYTPHNRLASITDARTGMTSFTYDKAGNLKTVTTPSPDGVLPSQITRYTYDIMGRVSLVTLPDGGIVQYTYTRTGELRTQSGARIYSAIYTYDPQGRLKTLKAGGSGITTWNYDPVRGFLISKKYANNNGTLYTYTSAGRLETRTWARGVTTTYSYNNAGDLLNVDYSDSTPDLNYIYNRRGRNIGVVSSLETVQLHYNKPGQLLKESHIGGPLAGVTVSNTYDSLFRRSALGLLNGSTSLASNSFTYDAASRLETVTSGSHSAAYTYWPNSSLVNTITFRNGSNIRLTTTKTFDKLNRLTSISSVPSADSARSFDYSYNSANQRYRVGLDDGSYWMYQYDNLGQVTSGRKYFSDDTPVPGQQFDYTFDDIGNRTSTTENGRIASYTANNLNQYTNRQAPGVVDIIGTADAAAVVTVNNQPTTRHGEYFYAQLNVDNSTSPVNLDVNIVTVLSGAGENGEDLVTEERYNVLLPASEESFAHNPDGNLIRDGLWKYRYDAENRLISIESPLNVPVEARRRVEYTRDYRNRLIERKGYVWSSGAWSLATQTKFVYDDVNLIAELDGIGDLMRSYVYGTDLSGRMQGAAGVGGLLYVSKYQPQISNHFVVNDGNGNVATLIDATTGKISGEYGYETFGKLLQESGSSAIENPLKFSTQYTDPFTDHILYQERANLPWIGRWLSRDPIGEQGGLNLYASCYNDCINFVDPLGLETFTATAVAKSYIATLGKQDRLIFGPEDRWDRLFLRQVTPSYARDAQELAEWLYGLDENPRSDSKDGQYRLFSKVKFIFDCKCGGKIDFKNTEGKGYTVEMDGGAEALWGLIRGTVNIDNLKIEKRGDAAYRFHWFTYGRPHFFAELSFQLIKFRRSVNIWHSVFGRIFCDGDKGYIEATLKGSSFPSHRLWLNGELKKTIHQGPLANLWKSRLPDPSFVQ